MAQAPHRLQTAGQHFPGFLQEDMEQVVLWRPRRRSELGTGLRDPPGERLRHMLQADQRQAGRAGVCLHHGLSRVLRSACPLTLFGLFGLRDLRGRRVQALTQLDQIQAFWCAIDHAIDHTLERRTDELRLLLGR